MRAACGRGRAPCGRRRWSGRAPASSAPSSERGGRAHVSGVAPRAHARTARCARRASPRRGACARPKEKTRGPRTISTSSSASTLVSSGDTSVSKYAEYTSSSSLSPPLPPLSPPPLSPPPAAPPLSRRGAPSKVPKLGGGASPGARSRSDSPPRGGKMGCIARAGGGWRGREAGAAPRGGRRGAPAWLAGGCARAAGGRRASASAAALAFCVWVGRVVGLAGGSP